MIQLKLQETFSVISFSRFLSPWGVHHSVWRARHEWHHRVHRKPFKSSCYMSLIYELLIEIRKLYRGTCCCSAEALSMRSLSLNFLYFNFPFKLLLSLGQLPSLRCLHRCLLSFLLPYKHPLLMLLILENSLSLNVTNLVTHRVKLCLVFKVL